MLRTMTAHVVAQQKFMVNGMIRQIYCPVNFFEVVMVFIIHIFMKLLKHPCICYMLAIVPVVHMNRILKNH